MASRKSKRKVFAPDFKKMSLNLEDVICPICLCVLIEPVTMPCSHELCMPCFKKNVQETSLHCPICRRRISTWSRKAAKENTLVNKERWQLIQELFPDKIRHRLNEEESDESSSDSELMTKGCQKLCEPGEIRKEYEVQLKRVMEEEEKEREIERRQSEALISELQAKDREEEERRKKEEMQLMERDGMIAMLLAQRLSQNSSLEESAVLENVLENVNSVLPPIAEVTTECVPTKLSIQHSASCGSNKGTQKRVASSVLMAEDTIGKFATDNYQLPSSSSKSMPAEESSILTKRAKFTDKQKGTTDERATVEKSSGKLSRSGSMESIDSISPELCHFRPIKTAPKTPPLRLPDGRVVEPKLIHATPRNLSLHLNSGLQCAGVSTQAVLKKRLLKVENDRRSKAGALLKSGVDTIIPAVSGELKCSESLPLKQSGKPLALVSSSPGNCSHSNGARIPPAVKPSHTGRLSGFKFVSCYLANKENPKVKAPIGKRLCTHKRKVRSEAESSKRLVDDSQSSDGVQIGLNMSLKVGHSNSVANPIINSYSRDPNTFGDAKKLHYNRNGSTMSTTVNRELRNVICNLNKTGHAFARQTPRRESRSNAKVAEEKVVTRLSSQRQQEAADYLLALKLQQEWNREFSRQYNTVNRRQGTYGEYNLRRRQATAIC